MSSLLSPEELTSYKEAISAAMDTFAQKEITWVRTLSKRDRFGEGGKKQENITLKVLCNYNVYRTWPISMPSATGETDKQSIQLFIHKQYLKDLGYINVYGYFEYSPDLDRFIIDGMIHKPFGDTPAAQLKDDDLFFTVIVKREETTTGNKR